jgi:hypothetical protein
MSALFPTFRPGITTLVEHSTNSSQIHVGSTTRYVSFSGHTAILFISKLTGLLNLDETLTETDASRSEALQIIQKLIEHNFIYLSSTPSGFDRGRCEDFSLQILSKKSKPELNLLGWRKTNNPISNLVKRQNQKIELWGSNRLAFALFQILQSSGFTNTKMKNFLVGELGPELIGGTPFRNSEIGMPLNQVQREFANEFGFQPGRLNAVGRQETKLENEHCSIIISTSQFDITHLPELIESGIPHLQIGNFSEGKVEIGPLVIPGKTPCYNCIEIWRNDLGKRSNKFKVAQRLAKPLELSASAVSYLAGLVTGLVDSYLVMDKSFLIGSSVVINLLKPLEYLERIWQPNPRCGCIEMPL